MSTIISIKNDNSYQVVDRAFSSPKGGSALLIVNKRTPMKAVREALLLAESNDAELKVVYTSKPALMDGSQTEGEVDQKFTLELEKGRAFLGSIASEARSLGVKAETSFVWAESSSDLLKQRDFEADLVLDETA